MKKDLNQNKMAVEYAVRTTNTRCHLLGKCGDNCPLGVKYCDYHSRYDAYRQGVADTLVKLGNMPWDKAMNTMVDHIKDELK